MVNIHLVETEPASGAHQLFVYLIFAKLYECCLCRDAGAHLLGNLRRKIAHICCAWWFEGEKKGDG
jgi:hypothetical protein